MKTISFLFLGLMASWSVCFPQTYPPDKSFYYVANTRPPDAYLSLRTEPTTSHGMNIVTMPNGTLLELIERRPDRWWRVRVFPSGQEGWALSGQGNRVWIACCLTAQGIPAADESQQAPVGFKTPSNNIYCQEFAAMFQPISVVTPKRRTVPCRQDHRTVNLIGATHMRFTKKTAQENRSAPEIPSSMMLCRRFRTETFGEGTASGASLRGPD